MMIDKDVPETSHLQGAGVVDRQGRFLTAFAHHGTITYAAKEIGIDRRTVQLWFDNDSYDFRTRMAQATAEHSDRLEARLFQQTLDVDKPNPILLIFALKGAKRDKYGDHVTVTNDNAHELLAAVRGLPSAHVVEGEVVAVDESGEESVRKSIER